MNRLRVKLLHPSIVEIEAVLSSILSHCYNVYMSRHVHQTNIGLNEAFLSPKGLLTARDMGTPCNIDNISQSEFVQRAIVNPGEE